MTPVTEIAGTIRPSRNTVFARHKTGEPARQPGHRQNAGRQREAAEDLHHAEVGADVVLGTLAARLVGAGHDLVDIASATTSCTTVPITISSAPSR